MIWTAIVLLTFIVANGNQCEEVDDERSPTKAPYWTGERWMTEFIGVNHANPSASPLPVGHDIVEFLDAEHLDVLLRTHVDEERPATLLMVYNSDDMECIGKADDVDFRRREYVPSRNKLMMATYDVSSHNRRAWYAFTPEMDIQKRFTITSCPEIIYIPRSCNGLTKWCTMRDPMAAGMSRVGCEDFQIQCNEWQVWDSSSSEDWRHWVRKMNSIHGTPEVNLGNRAYQTAKQRIEEQFQRNAFMPPVIDRFTETGFQAMEIPEEIYQELLNFQEKWIHKRYHEGEVYGVINKDADTHMVSLDNDIPFRQLIASKIQPILEEWSGLKLKFESFYGIREYGEGARLKNHIDRISTHVISATMNLNPLGETRDWPLEAIDAKGQRWRYDHPPGTMVLYESTTTIHGRPYPLFGGTHKGAFIHFSPEYWPTGHAHEEVRRKTTRNPIEFKHAIHEERSVGRFSPNNKAVHVPSKMMVQELGIPWVNYMRLEANIQILPLSVKFYNFYGENLYQFWVQPNGKERPSGGVAHNDVSVISTYEDHEFVFRSEKGQEVARFVMSKSEPMHVINPSSSARLRNKKFQRISELKEYSDKYFEEHGSYYLPETVRLPVQMFMWDTASLGQQHIVNTNFGYCLNSHCAEVEQTEFVLRVISNRPKVLVIDNVLNDFEKQHILKLATPRLGESYVGNGKFAHRSNTRSSKTAWLPHKGDNVIYTVCRRIMDIMGLPETTLTHTEQMQIVRYQLGENYNAHYDFTFPDTIRFATFGIYLESPTRGGGTGFPKANNGKGLVVNPPAGSAVLFYNLLADGNGDEFSVHEGMTVQEGQKHFANLWVHQDPKRNGDSDGVFYV